MLTLIDESDSDRVPTFRIQEATVDAAGGDLTAVHAARPGLVDIVQDAGKTALAAAVKGPRPVTTEAACSPGGFLDDCPLLEDSAAAELAKAARYKHENAE